MRLRRHRCYSIEFASGVFGRVYADGPPSERDLEVMREVYRALQAQGAQRKCTGCGTEKAVCVPLWKTQRKCCPECSHGESPYARSPVQDLGRT